MTEERPANGASRDVRGAPPDARASRALLSDTCALPPELVSKLPLPDGTMMHMVIHKIGRYLTFRASCALGRSSRARLLSATSETERDRERPRERFSGGYKQNPRNSCAASFNPELPPQGYDARKKTLKGIAPQKRNRDQAYWIVYSWLTNAIASQRGRAGKRKRAG